MSRGPDEPRGRRRVIPFRRPRPPASSDAGPGGRAFVEVHRCHPAEAVVVRSLFESEGIPTVVRSHVSQTVHPFSVGDQGRVAILVPEPQAPRSRTLLIRLASRRPPRS